MKQIDKTKSLQIRKPIYDQILFQVWNQAADREMNQVREHVTVQVWVQPIKQVRDHVTNQLR